MPELEAVKSAVKSALNYLGLDAFGFTMPRLSSTWTDDKNNLPNVDEEKMSLTLASGKWRAPIAGLGRKIKDKSALGVTLIRADGKSPDGPGLLLTLFPPAYLRLARLYAKTFENTADGKPVRPVPCHFFFAGEIDGEIEGWNYRPEDDLGLKGQLTIHDEDGMPIDPLAVAAAFAVLMEKYQVLQKKNKPTDSFNSDSQVVKIAKKATDAIVRVRLADYAGAPSDGGHFEGVEEFKKDVGLFTLKAGKDGAMGKINVQAATDEKGEFPPEARRLLLVGPATNGSLGDSFAPPALPEGTTLRRDFFSVRVVKLESYLLGSPNPNFKVAKAELKLPIRTNEALTFLVDGNDVLGAANAALTAATESLCVAQEINGEFNVPLNSGELAHWPMFHDGVDSGPDSLPINLRDEFDPSAAFHDGKATGLSRLDVVLTLKGLPAGAAVRVYPREFVDDAREERGNGAGGVVPADPRNGLKLLLKDPFRLHRSGQTTDERPPEPPRLRCDVMVVNGGKGKERRLYGNVETTVEGETDELPPKGHNLFDEAKRRSICNSGILGSGKNPLPDVKGLIKEKAWLKAAQALTGEGPKRDAPRLPTMARRDLLVAGLSGGNWRAVLAGGRLTEETHSAEARIGAPGGLGGRETQVVGVATENGQLAYDIARQAFRRTTYSLVRIVELANKTWDEPAAGNGSFAGAVLQTVAPYCETPELALFKFLVEVNLTSLPTSLDPLIDKLKEWVDKLIQKFDGDTDIKKLLEKLKGEIEGLKKEKKLDRLFEELRRELLSSCYGRRDTQWSLADAIGRARKFIYLESPGFCSTQGEKAKEYSSNLIEQINKRLTDAPGLHVIICTPKQTDFATGYESLAAAEVEDRWKQIIDTLKPQERVVAFHPVGFPGRPSRLETTVVIVDDVWGLVGSSTFRRRGLTFDGGSDLVFTDTMLSNGRCSSLTDFRRQLLADRLGITQVETNNFGTMPDARFVQLYDGRDAFQVIREMLIAGGLGNIERLWKGRTPGIEPIKAEKPEIANPEGLEFDLFSLVGASSIAGLSSSC